MAVTLESRLLRYRQGDVLTPLLDRYFRDPPDRQSEKVMAVIQQLATAQPRDRTRSFSASGISACMRAQTFKYLDYPGISMPDARLQAIFLNGRWVHLKWQAVLMEMGLADLDHLEVPVELPEENVRGTIDAIIQLNELPWIVDFKGVNPQSFAKYKHGEISPAYHWQLQIYMAATKIPRSLLLFENKATGEYFEQVVLPEHTTYIQAIARVRALNQFLDLKTLPKPLPAATHTYECQGCPFQLDCLKAKWTEKYLDEDEIPL